MGTDNELLVKFVNEDNEAAFRGLIDRYSGMVYYTCLRGLDNTHDAEDASQAVFIILARKAGSIRRKKALRSWLFRTANSVVSHMKREQARRKRREQEAAGMAAETGTQEDTKARWEEVRVYLNDAIGSLGRKQQEAVIAYFLEGKSQKEVADEVGCSEKAVQMRISRGLDRIRRKLTKKGIMLSVAALTSILTVRIAHAAPAGLAESCHSAVKAGCIGDAAGVHNPDVIAQGVIKAMMWNKIKMSVILFAVAVSAAAGIVVLTAGPEPVGNTSENTYEWPMLGCDAGWSNYSPDPRVKPPFRLKWATFVDSSHRTTMSVAGGRLYGRDCCLDAETGDLLWKAYYGGVTTPTFYKGRLYTAKKGLMCLDASTGKRIWIKHRYGIYGGAVSSLPVCNGAVYCGTFREHNGQKTYFACALDAENGKEIWSTPLIAVPKEDRKRRGYDLRVQMGEAAVAGGRVFYTTHVPPAVFALDRKTGKELWRNEGILGQVGIGADDTCVWATDERQGVVALDAKTGKKLWQWGGKDMHRSKAHYATEGTANKQPCAAYGMLFTSNYGRQYTALDAEIGKKIWVTRRGIGHGSCAPAVTSGGFIYSNGYSMRSSREARHRYEFGAVDHKTGKLAWHCPIGSRSCARATVAYGRVYLPGDYEYWCFEPVPKDFKNDPQPPPQKPAAQPAPMVEPFGGKPGTPEAGDKSDGGKDWPMYGGCAARCGLEMKIGLPIKEAWKFQTGGKVKSSPVIAGGLVYVGSDSGELFALNVSTGTKKWTTKITPPDESITKVKWIRSAPAVADGIVVCGADDGVMRAFDAKTGEPKWQFRTAAQIRSSPAIVGERVVFGSWDGRCYCVRLSDGKEFWRWKADDVRMRFYAPPAIASGRVYVSPWEDRKVFSLDLGTGKPVAGFEVRRPIPVPRVGLVQGIAIYRGIMVTSSRSSRGSGLLLDAASGGLLGQAGLYGSPVFPCIPVFSRDNLFQPFAGRKVAKLSEAVSKEATKGKKKKKRRTGFKNSARNIFTAGDLLIAATKAGTLEVYSLPEENSDEVPELAWEWTSPSKAEIQTAPAAGSGFLILGSDDGHIYGFTYSEK